MESYVLMENTEENLFKIKSRHKYKPNILRIKKLLERVNPENRYRLFLEVD